jgi:hypothetical protein
MVRGRVGDTKITARIGTGWLVLGRRWHWRVPGRSPFLTQGAPPSSHLNAHVQHDIMRIRFSRVLVFATLGLSHPERAKQYD